MNHQTLTEIKQIAKRHRWTMEELVYDQKMIEANGMMHWRVVDLYRYLCERAGGALQALRCIQSEVVSAGKHAVPPPKLSTLDGLKWYAREHLWAYHEAVTSQKEKEALELSKKASAMYGYLLEQYKSTKKILEMLTWLLLTQRCRRKSWKIASVSSD